MLENRLIPILTTWSVRPIEMVWNSKSNNQKKNVNFRMREKSWVISGSIHRFFFFSLFFAGSSGNWMCGNVWCIGLLLHCSIRKQQIFPKNAWNDRITIFASQLCVCGDENQNQFRQTINTNKVGMKKSPFPTDNNNNTFLLCVSVIWKWLGTKFLHTTSECERIIVRTLLSCHNSCHCEALYHAPQLHSSNWYIYIHYERRFFFFINSCRRRLIKTRAFTLVCNAINKPGRVFNFT